MCLSFHPSICLSTGGVPISHNAFATFPRMPWARHQGGGVPISHNALQHFPECHGVDTVGGVPSQVQWGVPSWEGTLLGDTLLGCTLPGVPCQGIPCWGVPCLGGYSAGGYPAGGYPVRVPPRPGQGGTLPGGTQVGQQKEYSLHGGQYGSCVHAGGLSCLWHAIKLRDIPHTLYNFKCDNKLALFYNLLLELHVGRRITKTASVNLAAIMFI